MARVKVRLPDRSYDVDIGPGRLRNLARNLKPWSAPRRILIVADARAQVHHGATLRRAIGRGFDADTIIVAPGERSKSINGLRRLLDRCRDHNLGRDGLIVAFGGGVVGDLAGFAAATYLRGVDLVMIPTTLLAQVDSSVGGKVGINYGGVKNLVGAFHQPSRVVADTELLTTLAKRERRSALAEVVKYGMIADPDLLTLLERHPDAVLDGEPGLTARVVAACCRIKARIVEEDEREDGIRAHLNYGHTIGHAIEAAARGRLRHGEAVALGMRGAARLAEDVGGLTRAERSRQDDLLDRLGLPANVRGLDVGDVLAKLKWDKKIRDGKIRFVLTRGIGSATLAPPIGQARVRRALAPLLS